MSHLEIGRPRFFDVERYMDTIEDFINADEIERALWLIKNPPAFYRDNPPPRLKEIEQSLHRQTWTAVQYAGIYEGVIPECWPGRAQVLEKLVRELNAKVEVPYIMELAPGSGFIEMGLQARELEFFYNSLGLDRKATMAVVPANVPTIFIAFEIIEHLANEWEIYQNYLKFNREADYVLLSTPLYTCAGGMSGWRERPLGHLRTFTPKEFYDIAQKMFQGFQWECVIDETIILKGRRV